MAIIRKNDFVSRAAAEWHNSSVLYPIGVEKTI
jgi:hypothetical protein